MINDRRNSNVFTESRAIESWCMPVVGQEVIKNNNTARQQDEIAQIKAKAFQESYDAGMKKAEAEIELIKAELYSHINILTNPLKLIDDHLKHLLSDCIVLLTKECLQAELKLDPEKILNAVEHVIKLLDEKSLKINLYLSSSDHQYYAQYLKNQATTGALNLIEDQKLTQGEIRLETSNSTIDASVANRMQMLCHEIFDASEQPL